MNVFIADDDLMGLETLRKYVDFRGDDAFTAPNGRIAMDVHNEKDIDLVITDDHWYVH